MSSAQFWIFRKSKPCPMGTWVNSFGEFSPDPFTISCHEYFACENGSKAAVGEELDILGLLSEETGSTKSRKNKFEGWGRPIVETFGTSRGSIFRLSRGSQLPYNEKNPKKYFLDFYILPYISVYLTPDIPLWRPDIY